jgi:hypothetical protein
MSKRLEIIKSTTKLNFEFNRCSIDDAVKQFRNELILTVKSVMNSTTEKDVQFFVDSVDGYTNLVSYCIESESEMKSRLKDQRERKQYERLKAKFEPSASPVSNINCVGTPNSSSILVKTDKSIVAWKKTGDFSVNTSTEIKINTGTDHVIIPLGTPVKMSIPSIGEDYSIVLNLSNPIHLIAISSEESLKLGMNHVKLGGFHYAAGGNATGNLGGDRIPSINEFSFWDLNFRPIVDDPRGMTLVDNSFWADIYLLGTDHLTNGTSKYNVTIADGNMDGSGLPSGYKSLNFHDAEEILSGHGKRMVSHDEFIKLAFGTTEGISSKTDPVNTILREAYTSKWGVMLSTGNMWIWGQGAALFGGSWSGGSFSGSRSSDWSNSATVSSSGIGARGACDHLILG